MLTGSLLLLLVPAASPEFSSRAVESGASAGEIAPAENPTTPEPAVPSITAPPVSAPGCMDAMMGIDGCARWAQLGFCNGPYHTHMLLTCPASCGVCPTLTTAAPTSPAPTPRPSPAPSQAAPTSGCAETIRKAQAEDLVTFTATCPCPAFAVPAQPCDQTCGACDVVDGDARRGIHITKLAFGYMADINRSSSSESAWLELPGTATIAIQDPATGNILKVYASVSHDTKTVVWARDLGLGRFPPSVTFVVFASILDVDSADATDPSAPCPGVVCTTFNTDCSTPILVGDVFGPIKIYGFGNSAGQTDRHCRACPRSADVGPSPLAAAAAGGCACVALAPLASAVLTAPCTLRFSEDPSRTVGTPDTPREQTAPFCESRKWAGAGLQLTEVAFVYRGFESGGLTADDDASHARIPKGALAMGTGKMKSGKGPKLAAKSGKQAKRMQYGNGDEEHRELDTDDQPAGPPVMLNKASKTSSRARRANKLPNTPDNSVAIVRPPHPAPSIPSPSSFLLFHDVGEGLRRALGLS